MKQYLRNIKQFGYHQKVLIWSDGEPAMGDLLNKVSELQRDVERVREPPARLCELDPIRRTAEQLHVQRHFQGPHLAGHCRLGHCELSARRREAAEAGRSLEHGEPLESLGVPYERPHFD